MWIVDQLYDGLVELTADLKVVPCLATSWELDSSLTTYTFHLRRDVQFTTGRPLTARDVQFSLERLRDSTVISSGGWILESVQPGGIKAVDDSTLVIQLIQAYPPFLGLLTTAYASVMDANEALKPGWEARTDVIGSGPFQLAWWLPDAGIVMHRNEAYWEVDEAGSSLPYLEAVHVDVLQDMGGEFLGLTQGRYDFISGLHPAYMETLLDEYGELRPDFQQALTLDHVPFLKTDYIGVVLHGAQTPEALNNPLVRRAMSAAIDRAGLVRHLRRNSVTPTDHFVPPSMLERPMSTPTVQMDSAKHWLELAGYPEGKGVGDIVLSTTSDYVDICAALQHDWAQLGLRVEVDVVPAAMHRERVAQGETALFYKSWLADHADAENFLGLFVEANFSPHGPNYTHHASEEYERLFAAAMAEVSDASKRRQLYGRLDSIVHASMPVMPLFHDRVTHVLSRQVKGWSIHPVNRLDLRRVRKANLPETGWN